MKTHPEKEVGEVPAQITIHVDQPIHGISPWIYGQFLEHINYSIDLGIHAEMLAERSFEMATIELPSALKVPAHAARPAGHRGGLDPDFPAFQWSSTLPPADPLAYRKIPGVYRDPVDYGLIGKTASKALGIVEGQRGELTGEADTEGAPNGERYLSMTLHKDLPRPEGIRQEFVPAREGEELDGFVFLRTPNGGSVEVGLRPRGGGPSYAKAVIEGIGLEWAKYTFRLTPQKTDLDAEFYLAATQRGTYHIDFVSLMPAAKRNSAAPFRDDLVEACKRLKPTIIRWPGGCFVNIYDWKAGIGGYEERQPVRSIDWGYGGETEPCTFGTDEFITFCRMVGAEPLIVFDVLRGVQDALDWIEYCNGPVTSQWGARRAANGHPEPYNVTCWSVDNERWALGYDQYCSLTNEFVDAIRARYPDFKIWIVGTGQPLEKPEDPDSRSNWGPEVVRRTGERSDFVSFHCYYGNGLADNLSLEEDFRREAEAYRKAVPGKEIQIAFDEWMPYDAVNLSRRSELCAALMFNSLERCGDIVGMASAAPWLWHQRLGTSASDTLIHHDHRSWFPTPFYLANELWATQRAPVLLKTQFSGPTLPLEMKVRRDNRKTTEVRAVPVLDISTTYDPADGRIVLKVVNRDAATAVRTQLLFEGAEPADTARFHLIHDPDPAVDNTLENPEAIRIQSSDLQRAPGGWTVMFPPRSASVIVLQSKQG